MKKFTLMCAALATAMAASAQWNTDNTPVKIGTATKTNSPKAAVTKDGKVYISWRSSARVGNALCYSFPHLQLLDKDGKVMFGDNGLDISDHKSPSWCSDYSLAVTPDGCAIVSNSDSRSEEVGGEDLERYNAFTPVWYKIDQEQNYVWGLDGLALTNRVNSPFTDTYVVGDDVYLRDNTSSYDEVNYFNRATPEGTLAYEEPKKIFGQVVPSSGTDFITIGSGSDGPEAQRYTRDGKAVWDSPLTFATSNFGGHDLHPYKIGEDGKGGAFATWVRYVGNFGHMICTQHITADGEADFGLDAMDVMAKEDYDVDYPKQAVDTKNCKVLVSYPYEVGGGTYKFAVQIFNAQGDRLCGDYGNEIDSKDGDMAGFAYNNYGALSTGDGEWLICYSNVLRYANEELYVARLDKDGKVVWKQQIGTAGDFNDVNFVKGEDCSYVIFKTTDDDNNSFIGGARIFDDGTFVQDNTTALPYSIDFTGENKPEGWTALDKSDPIDSYGHWAFGSSYIKVDGKKKYINSVHTGMAFDSPWNDYYISPEFKLDANKAYKVKTQAMRDGDSYTLTLEYGTSLTDDATYTKFADYTAPKDNFVTTNFQENTLKVAESGNYRIAFHTTSTNDNTWDALYLFSFSIEEDETNGIENVSDDLSNVTSATIRSIDGKLVKTISGDKFNSASLAPGMYIITVKDAQGRTKSMKITK